MAKNVLWSLLFTLIAVLLQSTLLGRLAVYTVAVPDLALGVLVFTAYSNGMMTGQVTGFFSGLISDFISAAPLGLNALIRTITGALCGLIKGVFVFGSIFLPMLLCAAATALKAALLIVLHALFADAVPVYPSDSPVFLLELSLNTLIAPVLFALLGRFDMLLARKKEA
jgi:rod shape-determining protein MreD